MESSFFVKKTVFSENFNEFYSRQIPFFFLIDFDVKQFFIKPLSELADGGLLYNFNGFTNHRKSGVINNIEIIPISFDYLSYSNKFSQVIENFKMGNSYLLNLTLPVELFIQNNFEEIYSVVKSKYKVKFYDDFVFFSPESFVKIEDGKISTYPMKGTIDGSEQDCISKLMNDEKELCEHLTVVDLLRNDLSMIADNVSVNKFRFVSEIKTLGDSIFQTSSEIVGDLNDSFFRNPAEIFLSLLPAGSVTGAPKLKTVEIIRSIEGYDRGFYTGVSGIYDGQLLDSCVNIRFIEHKAGRFFYKSGGGLTIYSECLKEYNEVSKKIYAPIC